MSLTVAGDPFHSVSHVSVQFEHVCHDFPDDFFLDQYIRVQMMKPVSASHDAIWCIITHLW